MQTTEINRPTVNGVANVASLRALAPCQYARVSLDGYTHAHDGGGGMFVWDSSASSADNGGSIIQPTGLSGNGRWIRLFDGPVDVRWFGAIADGVTDCTAAIQATHDFATPLCRPVYLPNTGAAYIISDHILVDSNATLFGDPCTPGVGQAGSTIQLASGANVTMLRNRNILAGTNGIAGTIAANITLRNLIFDGNYAGNPGSSHWGPAEILSDKTNPWQGCGGQIGFYGVSGLVLDNITIRDGWGFGVQLAAVTSARIPYLFFDAHKRDGLHVNCQCSQIDIGAVAGTTGDDLVALNQWDWRNSCPATTQTSSVNIEGFITDVSVDKILPANITWSPLKITTGDGGSVARVTVGLIEGSSTYDGCFWGYVADGEVPSHTSSSLGQIMDLTIGRIHLQTFSYGAQFGHLLDLNCQISALRIGQILADQYHFSPYPLINIPAGCVVNRFQIDSLIQTADAVNNQTCQIDIAGTVNDLIIGGLDVTGPGTFTGSNQYPFIRIEPAGTLSRLKLISPRLTQHAGIIQQVAGANAADIEIHGGTIDNFIAAIWCQGTMTARAIGTRFTSNQGAAVVLDNAASNLSFSNSDCDWASAGGNAINRTAGAVTWNGTTIPPNLNPGLPAGMVFWFKADAGVYSDAGTTPATNGQTVEQWNDQSGRGNNAAQAISGARPVFAAGVLCGLPGILFNGASDTLPITSPAVCAQYFVVGMSGTITWNNYGGFIESQNDGTYPRLGTMRPGTTAFHDAAPPSAVRKDGVDLWAGYFDPVTGGEFDMAPITHPMLLTVNTNSPSSSRKMALGSLDLSDFLSCCIFEIIGFASVLSAADRNLVELYLQNKWGTPRLPGNK